MCGRLLPFPGLQLHLPAQQRSTAAPPRSQRPPPTSLLEARGRGRRSIGRRLPVPAVTLEDGGEGVTGGAPLRRGAPLKSGDGGDNACALGGSALSGCVFDGGAPTAAARAAEASNARLRPAFASAFRLRLASTPPRRAPAPCLLPPTPPSSAEPARPRPSRLYAAKPWCAAARRQWAAARPRPEPQQMPCALQPDPPADL